MRNRPCSSLAAVALLGLWLSFTGMTFGGDSSWRAYNDGVQAYAGSNYPAAFQKWQNLSLQQLPRSLERPVWFQLGNTQFRLGEPLERNSPEEAAEFWRRSCEAYRSALVARPRDAEVRHNLAFVQRRLALLTHRLGMEAFRAADGKPLDTAIDLLQNSTQQLEASVTLAPDDVQIRQDRDRVLQVLRERLKDRAQAAENKADELVRQNNDWANDRAEDQYRAALQDLSEARRPAGTEPARNADVQKRAEALEHAVTQAADRVSQKLSRLLTKRGQQEQKEGDQQSQWNPDGALNQYESALNHYEAAQQARPDNAEARKGELEVRQAMEKLNVLEGLKELARGKQALAEQNPRAAPELSSALGRFESALQLNSRNPEARAGAEEARRLLPEALNLAGRTQLAAGDHAEPNSASEALNRYQEAAQDFRQSLEIKANQPPAEQGLQEAEAKLARARQKVASEAEAAAKAGRPRNRPPDSLQSLLGQVEEKKRTFQTERQRQQAQRNTQPRKPLEDW